MLGRGGVSLVRITREVEKLLVGDGKRWWQRVGKEESEVGGGGGWKAVLFCRYRK